MTFWVYYRTRVLEHCSLEEVADGEVEDHRVVACAAVEWEAELEAQRTHWRIPANTKSCIRAHVVEAVVLILSKSITSVEEDHPPQTRRIVDRELSSVTKSSSLLPP